MESRRDPTSLKAEVVEVMDGVGGGEGWDRVLHSVLHRPLPGHLPCCEALSGVSQPLDEPLLLPVGSEVRVLGGGGVELLHANHSIVWQQGLAPDATYVVLAVCHQDISHGASWHVPEQERIQVFSK